MPREHETVVNVLLFILAVILVILILYVYFILQGITPETTAIETALNFT